MTGENPFSVRLVFLRIAWMERYQGIERDDTPVGGGKYVAESGLGEEIFNFQEFEGRCYGGCRPPGGTRGLPDARINLKHFEGGPRDNSASGVLAVWVATSPSDGAVIVGWYSNSTVFREWQSPPAGSGRTYKGKACGYYVTASSDDTVLLPPDERDFSVPQLVKGGFGHANVWYAEDRNLHRDFRDRVLQYIASWKPAAASQEASAPRQVDPFFRQRVEEAAVRMTTDHYSGLGYTVDSVERDNVGWDLNAVTGNQALRLEVKGLSGDSVTVELTPNEYRAMQEQRDTYRICVVTNALQKPRLEIFSYSQDANRWESGDGRVLNLEERVAVRCTVL